MNKQLRPAHAEFGPSSLKYVAACGGWKNHGQAGSAADFGTRVHQAMQFSDRNLLQSEEENEMFEELISAESVILGPILEDDANEHYVGFVEETLDLNLGQDLPETYGTVDKLVVHGKDAKFATVIDYKTGYSKIDPPLENYQSMAYALGVFKRFRTVQIVDFHFIVPRNGGTLSGTFFRAQVDELHEKLRSVIKKGKQIRGIWESGNTPDLNFLTPNDGCTYCYYKQECPALGHLAGAVVKSVSPEFNIPDTLDPRKAETAGLSKLLDMADLVGDWADSVKECAKARCKEGEDIPGWGLKPMGVVSTISDEDKAVSLAVGLGLSAEAVAKCQKLNYSSLKKELTKAKVLDLFETSAQETGVLEKKDKNPALSRKQSQ